MKQKFLVYILSDDTPPEIVLVEEETEITLNEPHICIMQEGAWYNPETNTAYTLCILHSMSFVFMPLDLQIAESALFDYLTNLID